MRLLMLLFLNLIFLCGFAQSQKIKVWFEESKDLELGTFLNKLEDKANSEIFYKSEWIKGKYVSIDYSDSVVVENLLTEVLRFTDLTFYISESGNIYLFPKSKKFVPLSSLNLESKEKEEFAGYASSEYIKTLKANIDTTYVIGEKKGSFSNRKVKLIVVVSDKDDGELLVGATMFIKELNAGAVSNNEGVINFEIKPGNYSAEFKCLGKASLNCNLTIRSSGKIEVELSKANVAINEIIVSGNNQKRGASSGYESVDFLTMKEIPVLLGEKDVIKVAQMLPGIVSVGEGSGGINVRGGNADQNLFYLNDIPIYNTSHLFGFFSSVNSSVVDRFSVYKGYIPVQYGGRLSSIFDIQVRKIGKSKFYTEGSISPISANVSFDVPLIKEKLSLLVSARSSYSNWILHQLKDPDLRNSHASFNDFLISVEYQINKRSSIHLLLYNSFDDFNYATMNDYKYGNRGGSFTYSARLNDKLGIKASLINSSYNFENIDKASVSSSYIHNYTINHSELKTIFNYNASKNHAIDFGLSSILYQLDRGVLQPYGAESVRKSIDFGQEKGVEQAFFINDGITIGSRLKLDVGLRYSFFYELGPKLVNYYLDNTEILEENKVDEYHFANNEIISRYNGPELRFGGDYKLTPGSSLKISYTQMRQYLFMLSNTVSISPTDQWKLVGKDIAPLTSKMYSIGYYWGIPRLDLTFSTEVYAKLGNNIVDYKDGVDFLNSPFVETTILQGQQRVTGVEFMVSKENGLFNGWLSYTYSRSNLTFNGQEQWDKINNGISYPSNFDKPHVLNLVANLKVSRRFSISSNLAYNTGRPVTLPIGFYYLEGQPYIDYSNRNEYRIPDYLRADFSVKLEGNLKKKKPIHSYWMLSVYNAFGRKNANSVYFISKNGQINGYQYSVIGAPIYTISWNWKLGNYASN